MVCTSTNGVDKKEVKEMNVNRFVKYVDKNEIGASIIHYTYCQVKVNYPRNI